MDTDTWSCDVAGVWRYHTLCSNAIVCLENTLRSISGSLPLKVKPRNAKTFIRIKKPNKITTRPMREYERQLSRKRCTTGSHRLYQLFASLPRFRSSFPASWTLTRTHFIANCADEAKSAAVRPRTFGSGATICMPLLMELAGNNCLR